MYYLKAISESGYIEDLVSIPTLKILTTAAHVLSEMHPGVEFAVSNDNGDVVWHEGDRRQQLDNV